MEIESYLTKFRNELELRNYCKTTIKTYHSCIGVLLLKFKDKQSPKEINVTEIKQFLLDCKTINTRHSFVNSIRTYYRIMFNQLDKAEAIPFPRREYHLPKVIEHTELLDKINAIPNRKHRAIIALGYGCSLRVSEVINLKMNKINRKENIIFIEQAKHKKDRIVKVSDFVLGILDDYYKNEFDKPKVFLFEGWAHKQYSSKSCQEVFKKYISKEHSFHSLRRSGITTMINNGIDSLLVKQVSGHKDLKSLAPYYAVSNRTISKIQTAI